MEKARTGEIAYLYLKYFLKQRGLPLDQNFRRRIGNIAKRIGVPTDELLEFATALAKEILEEVTSGKEDPSEHFDEDLTGHGGGH